jgi:hypothetical protein
VTLVPELPGDLAITTVSFNEFRQRRFETDPALMVPEQISLHRVRVGRRRFLADGTGDPISPVQWASLELHTDGAGACGLYPPSFRRRGLFADPEQQGGAVWPLRPCLRRLGVIIGPAPDGRPRSRVALVSRTCPPCAAAFTRAGVSDLLCKQWATH